MWRELRSPLASALSGVSVAAELTDAADPRAAHLRRVRADLEHLSSLISELDCGRVGRAVPRAAVDLADVVQAAVSGQSAVRLEPAREPIPVEVDADELGRALGHMIANALEAGANEVKIRLASREGAALIDVADDGPGVPAELRERVFEPFVSGRARRGLGLALARAAVQRLGGRISLERARRGASFRLILPLAPG